jgi:Flp pilus assembly pilin Flp
MSTFHIARLILASRVDSTRGQTMAEYAVVLGVVTLAVIAALTFLSGGINTGLSSVSSSV